jgi:hypothetical protein
VTLVLTVNGPESIWLLADRRLSFRGRPLKEDARKVMFLNTTDGAAIVGYAGLGKTRRGTEPSDWMSAVLRGRNLSLEQSLGVLAEAIKKKIPAHMPGHRGLIHSTIVPVFLGKEPRLYSIDLVVGPDHKPDLRYARVLRKPTSATSRPPRLGLCGTGGVYLAQKKEKEWMRSLLRVVKANDRGQVSPLTVADHLANLNIEVHLAVSDKSVGPCCVVAWRHGNGGGGHQFYTGTTRDANSPLPTIEAGIDVKALLAMETPHMIKMFEARRGGQPPKEPNKDEINARLARLPDKPDENLL